MENRWSDRRELNLHVDVLKVNQKLLSCRCKDIGLGGTFIEKLDEGCSVVTANSDVELVFHIDNGNVDAKYYLHAKVIRVSDSGIGLKFHEFDTSVFRALQELINYKAVSLSAVSY